MIPRYHRGQFKEGCDQSMSWPHGWVDILALGFVVCLLSIVSCSISNCLSVFSWKHPTPATTRFLVQNVSFRAIFRDFLGSNSWLSFVTEAGLKFSIVSTFDQLSKCELNDPLVNPGWGIVWELRKVVQQFWISCFACWCMDFLVCFQQVGSQVAMLSRCFCEWFLFHSAFSFSCCLEDAVSVARRPVHEQDTWTCPTKVGKKFRTSKGLMCGRCSPSHWFSFLVLCLCCRIGEAKVPGPNEWKIGTCNPAGLNNKGHLFEDLSADLWLISETHLTSTGCQAFKNGLRRELSEPHWFVQGYPVRPRSTVSNLGTWAGVGVLSRHPTQALPHDWAPWAYESSRIVATTTYLNQMWVSGVVMYGMPTGPTHPQAKARTGAMLQEAVRRVLCMDGPRFLAGDFNHDLEDLAAIEVLRTHHFVEVQDLFHLQTGIAPKPTCKMKTRRDFLFISVELIPMFQKVEVEHCHWVDHASVLATFKGNHLDLVRYPWPLPLPLPWDKVPERSPGTKVRFDPSLSCEVGYSQLWQRIEQDFECAAQEASISVGSKHFGRGKRKNPVKVVGSIKPMMPGRNGEACPKFFGISHLHRAWFRQLRRLQSYIRLASVQQPQSNHVEHAASLWNAIYHASGFKPSFASWWDTRDLKDMQEPSIPSNPPSCELAHLFFEGLQLEVRDLENRLRKQHRGHQAVTPNHVLANLYRSVKRSAPKQVDVLVDAAHTKVAELDTEDIAVVIEPPTSWNEALPIRINGQVVDTNFVSNDKLWLNSLEGIQIGDPVTQNRSIGKLELVFEAFIEHWSKFWVKHASVPMTQWQPVLDFAKDKLGFAKLPSLSVSCSLIRATAKSKKAQAAVGLDGVSRADILGLSHNQLQGIQMIYEHAQTTGQWPQQTVEGIVKSLAKVDHPSQVTEFRPITVFSIVYRLWSSIHSRYWLAQVDQRLAPYLCGNRAGHQAATLWRKVLEEVEWSQMHGGPLCGLIIDLTKAYNTLPRLPCLALALILGVEPTVVSAWAGALSQMQRRFWVNGSVSRGIGSDRGFPEGCGMSCLAMCLLDQIWHLWIQQGNSLARPMSFVDNWEVLCGSPASVLASLEATLQYAKLLDLHVDEKKTCAWATQGPDRQVLRQAGIPVVHDIRDLGAHIVYSRQIRNATQKHRFTSLDEFWIKLRRAPGGFQAKVRVIRTAGWPRALHGIAASLVGKKRFHNLRVGMVKGLAMNKPGINAFVFGQVVGNLDPQFLAIVETLRDCRRLGDGSHMQQMFQAMHAGETSLGQGTVTKVLQQRLQIVGWHIEQDGCVHSVGAGHRFHILQANWHAILWHLEKAWHKVVCVQVAHRPGFESLDCVNVPHTRTAVNNLPLVQQGICRRLLAGALVTNEHACFWSQDGNDKCIKCGQPDSLHHRFWQCSGTRAHRAKLDSSLVQVIEELPRVLTDHGWTLRSHLADWWEDYLQHLSTEIPAPECEPQTAVIDVFTDGSCYWPCEAEIRMAAWAVCLAGPVHQNASVDETTVLGSGWLPGVIQTAFRAELMALRVVLQWAVCWRGLVRVWLDCQGVIDRYNLHVIGAHAISAVMPNGDLWHEVVQLANRVGTERIQLIKVTAHVTIHEGLPEALRWAHMNNGCVDRAAKDKNSNRGAQFWVTWKAHADRVVCMQQLADQIRQHQVEVLDDWLDGPTVSTCVTKAEPKRGKEHPQLWQGVSRLDEVPLTAGRILSVSFATVLLQWWNEIVNWEAVSLRWISFTQLYIHFQLCTGHPGLVKKGRNWHDPQSDLLIIPESFSFRERCKWFRLTIQQLWKAADFKIATASTRPASQVLQCHIGCASVCVVDDVVCRVENWLVDRVPPILGCGSGLDQIPVAW